VFAAFHNAAFGFRPRNRGVAGREPAAGKQQFAAMQVMGFPAVGIAVVSQFATDRRAVGVADEREQRDPRLRLPGRRGFPERPSK